MYHIVSFRTEMVGENQGSTYLAKACKARQSADHSPRTQTWNLVPDLSWEY